MLKCIDDDYKTIFNYHKDITHDTSYWNMVTKEQINFIDHVISMKNCTMILRFSKGRKTSISIACEGATLAHLTGYLKNSELVGWDDRAHWD